ncbi:TonB-dependent receptor [Algivirga pacifica]
MKHAFFRYTLFFLFFLSAHFSNGQQGKLNGYIYQENGIPLEGATITAPSLPIPPVYSNKNGQYEYLLPLGTQTIVFSHPGYSNDTLYIEIGDEMESVHNVRLLLKSKELSEITVEGKNIPEARESAGTIKVDAEALQEVITPFGDFNQKLIAGGALGIYGNNEFSSAYSVRGGNFDENLVYVNNIQVYRPFLARSGQQEGLSFINPDMVGSVSFSSGGWQPHYGDKLSSVLSIAYAAPKEFKASVTASLLGGGIFAGGKAGDRVSYMAGFRHKSAEYLLGTLDTDGEYLPRFYDLQSYVDIDLSPEKDEKTTLGILTSYARNRYKVVPTLRETRFGTFNNAKKLTVDFEGREQLDYDTFQGGLNLGHWVSENLKTNLIASALKTQEREFIDLESGYRIADVKERPGEDINEEELITGVGSEYQYARNAMDAEIYALESRNLWNLTPSLSVEFGLRYDHEKLENRLYEYGFKDSVGYIIERTPVLESLNQIENNKVASYLQGTFLLGQKQTLTAGIRTLYTSLNGQWLYSPRLQYAIQPNWKKDIVFSLSTGIYHQPPFYREMIDFQGNLNTDLLAQSSWHLIGGMDFNFEKWKRPFKFITEIYYKQLWNVVAYDVDNVRIRYYANNNTTAYVAGTDLRLSGEFIEGIESWFTLSLMSTREDLEEDSREYVRRPTDQRMTFSMFFRDHLPNNPSMQVHLRMLYGSGLPYGPPGDINQRALLSQGTDYTRADIGFSKIITFNKSKGNIAHHLTLGLEILNMFGNNNNISFTWVDDFVNQQKIAVPNTLSQRFLNFSMKLDY